MSPIHPIHPGLVSQLQDAIEPARIGAEHAASHAAGAVPGVVRQDEELREGLAETIVGGLSAILDWFLL